MQSVLDGHDVLALLPTGGGKSLCYQLPAVLLDGVCFVVSPLIALMRDQVENLRKKGISATYIYSGMSGKEVLVELENIRNGKYKLVYVSPERLQNKSFLDSFKRTKVSFLAVDEAHCISQWGHDFRPQFRMISDLRELKPEMNILALTASATPQVKDDIISQLDLRSVEVFTKSFHRPNLSYNIVYTDDKRGVLVKEIQNTPGTGIVYVRNRRKTIELTKYLREHQISADFYHAGLDAETRNKKQDQWTNGSTRIIVSTNAFGMGIDKPDVRLVMHYGLPDGLEAYYQEAGRAGRDEKPARCVLLYTEADVVNSKTLVAGRFPSLKRVQEIYENLCNYFQLALYSGQDARFDLDMVDFCSKFENKPIEVYAVIKLLEKLEYLLLSEGVSRPSRLKISVSSTELYDFQLRNPGLDPLIKLILRSYSGIFDYYAVINEETLANRLNTRRSSISEGLKKLHGLGIIEYYPRSDKPFVTFLTPRVHQLADRNKIIDSNRERTEERLQALIDFIESEECRSRRICQYFGESLENDCGKCDVCRLKQRYSFSRDDFVEVENKIKEVIGDESKHIREVVGAVSEVDSDKLRKVLRWLMDDGKIRLNNRGNLEWIK